MPSNPTDAIAVAWGPSTTLFLFQRICAESDRDMRPMVLADEQADFLLCAESGKALASYFDRMTPKQIYTANNWESFQLYRSRLREEPKFCSIGTFQRSLDHQTAEDGAVYRIELFYRTLSEKAAAMLLRDNDGGSLDDTLTFWVELHMSLIRRSGGFTLIEARVMDGAVVSVPPDPCAVSVTEWSRRPRRYSFRHYLALTAYASGIQ